MNWCCDAMLQAKAASASVGRDRHPRDVVPSGWPAEDDDTAFQPSKDRVGPGKEPTNMQDLDAAKRTGRSRCLGQVLQEMGLSKHLQVLQEAQVTDVGDLGRLTEGEMRQLGLSVEHASACLRGRPRFAPSMMLAMSCKQLRRTLLQQSRRLQERPGSAWLWSVGGQRRQQ